MSEKNNDILNVFNFPTLSNLGVSYTGLAVTFLTTYLCYISKHFVYMTSYVVTIISQVAPKDAALLFSLGISSIFFLDGG